MWVSFRVTILPVCESTIDRTILDEKAWSQPCVTFVMALSHRKPFALIQVEAWDDGMVHSNTLFTFLVLLQYVEQGIAGAISNL